MYGFSLCAGLVFDETDTSEATTVFENLRNAFVEARNLDTALADAGLKFGPTVKNEWDVRLAFDAINEQGTIEVYTDISSIDENHYSEIVVEHTGTIEETVAKVRLADEV